MAELDDETLERVRRWCAEAGRQTAAAEIRAALAPLSWDELLHAKALLADPPPARPLGPAALADLARGTPADVAAEREREGRYRGELEDLAPEAAADEGAPPAPRPAQRGRRAGSRRPSPPVIHRRRDRPAPAPPASPAAPSFERLLDPPGRAVLERLVRKHGARRSFLLAELAGWRTVTGAAPTNEQLSAVLEHHGLARSFAHRERDELLHALRAARGDLRGAAARVGLERDAYERALARLGATADAERLRDERRAELRARATIAERCRMLAAESDQLADLGLLDELERELRERLPEHLRALRAGASSPSLAVAFARSVSLEVADAAALARRVGVELAAPEGAGRAPAASRPARPGAAPGPRAPRAGSGERRPRPSGERRPRPSPGARPPPPRKAGRTAGPGSAGPAREGRPPPRRPGPPRGDARPRPRPGGPRKPRRSGPRGRS
ncbi:MAG TPA: Fis family transcriptional regulator [Anaeromyxobacter sp.]|nr:Fis family transcriptional regulator [Anaeromyxobacter sp.]